MKNLRFWKGALTSGQRCSSPAAKITSFPEYGEKNEKPTSVSAKHSSRPQNLKKLKNPSWKGFRSILNASQIFNEYLLQAVCIF